MVAMTEVIVMLVVIEVIWELIFLFFLIYCGLFVLILVVLVLFLLSQSFGQISPLAFFRWLTETSDRNAESCNKKKINSQIKKLHLKMIPIKRQLQIRYGPDYGRPDKENK